MGVGSKRYLEAEFWVVEHSAGHELVTSPSIDLHPFGLKQTHL